MSKRSEIERFGLHSYDDYLCLRPPWLLIACLIFLCRGLAVYVLLGVAKGVPAGLGGFVDTDYVWTGALAAVPAALVLYAAASRVPSAPQIARWLWRRGRALTVASSLAYVAIGAAQLGADPRRWLHGPVAAKALLAAELGIVAYVLLSARVRAAFLDFPAA